MLTVEHDIALLARPGAVWRVLTNFEGYRNWHPYIRLDGEPVADSAIDYIFTSKLIGRRAVPMPARVTKLDPEHVLSWRMRFRPWLEQEETYLLKPHPLGTLLVHRLVYRGLLSSLCRGGLERRGHQTLRASDAALRAFMSGGPKGIRRHHQRRTEGRRG
jgi:uncharacterized protein YndB with AHSA1/START domain